MKIKFRSFSLWKEKAGIISPNEIWCCMYGGTPEFPSPCYFHNHNTLLLLIYSLITEWKHDKHLVGY